MSLSTQLNRGTRALPLLALLGLLAFAAGEPVDAQPERPRELPPAIGAVAETACGPQLRPQLLLAQAPADLGPIAQRQGAGCRVRA